jgi:hypothetical protein
VFEHGFQASVHFFFFDKLTARGGLHSLFDRSQETRFFAKIADDDIGHELFGGGAGFGGNLRDLRLLLGREVDFHGFRVRKRLALGKRSKTPH